MMKKLIGSMMVVIVAIGVRALAEGEGASASEAEVRTAVQHYIDGAASGSAAEFNTAWDVTAGHMKYVRKGEDGKESIRVVPIAEAIKSWCSAPKAESWGKITDVTIVDDKMAHATVEMLWQGTIYVDYLSLYNVGGEWKIVNKIFVSRGKRGE
jgi:hypothetical protein